MHATQLTNRAPETGTIDIEQHVARARRMQAKAMADSLRRRTRQAGHAIGAVQRSFRSHVRFWATERSLNQLSDQSLADMGIPRHAIPLAVRGIDWRTVGPDETPWSLRLRSLADRFTAWRERQARRQRALRELMAYSDRDLEELGIFRSDIRRLASAAA